MSIFEYIMILMTIVLGFGITSNLRAISKLKLEDLVLDSFVVLGYYVTIIVLQLDYWMSIWSMSTRESWTLLDIVIWLHTPLVLFLAGAYLDRSHSEDEAEVRFTRKAALVALYFWTLGAFVTIAYYYQPDFFSWIYFSMAVFVVMITLGFMESKPKQQLISSVGSVLFSLYFLIAVGSNRLLQLLPATF